MSGRVRWLQGRHATAVVSVDVSPDGAHVVSVDDTGHVIVHARARGRVVAAATVGTSWGARVRFVTDERVAVKASTRGTWRIAIVTRALAPVAACDGDPAARERLGGFDACRATGRIAVATDECVNPNWDEHRARIWLVDPAGRRDPQPAVKLEDTRGGDVAWLAPDRLALTLEYASGVTAWDLTRGVELGTRPVPGGWRSEVRGIDAARLGVLDPDGGLHVCAVGGGAPEPRPAPAGARAVAFGPGGLVVIGVAEGRVGWARARPG